MNWLKRGKVDEVKTYLYDIKSFWGTSRSGLDEWLAEIEQGKKPELDRFSGIESGPFVRAIVWLASLWPVIVSAVFVYIQRKRIHKRLWVFVFGALTAYVAMYAANAAFAYAFGSILSNVDDLSATALLLLTYLPMAVIILLPVLTIFVVARFFQKV